MDVLEKDEFLKTYRSISAQLKKKFVGFRQEVRRPNVIDAVDGFESLSRQQLDLGFTELSAACRLAAAQLEQSIAGFNAGSSSARSGLEYNNLYVESARTFFLSNEQASTYECYEGAISSTNDASLAWLTSMEAGQTALHLNEYLNAISFFTKAYQLAENYTEKNISGNFLASSFIRQGYFTEALKTLAFLQINQKNLMTQTLLALNLKRSGHGESHLSQILFGVLENSNNYLFQPQSLQNAVDALKLGELDETSIQIIWSYLNLDQQQLLLYLFNSKLMHANSY